MTAKSIFLAFITRAGSLTEPQAIEELARVEGRTCDEYLTMSRVGATFPLDRMRRREIYLTWENAQNHASVEAEMRRNACPKCNGTGNLPHYYYIADGVCFACGGSGKRAA